MLRPSLGSVAPSPCRARSSLGVASLRSSIGSNVSLSARKDLVPLSRDKAKEDPLFLARICKNFGAGYYYGQVIAIDADVKSGERAYHVAYEDGDEEHLSAPEIRQTMVRGEGPEFSAAGSRRASAATLNFSCAPTPRPSSAGAAAGAVRWQGSSMPRAAGAGAGWTRQIGNGALVTAAVVAALAAAGALSSLCFSCSLGFGGVSGGTEWEYSDAGARNAVAGLAPPLPPWAHEVPKPAASSWVQEQAAAMATGGRSAVEQDQKVEEVPKATGSEPSEVPAWAAAGEMMPLGDSFARLPQGDSDSQVADETNEGESRPSVAHEPIPHTVDEVEVEVFTGEAPVTVQSVSEEEVAAAIAAATQALSHVAKVSSVRLLCNLGEVWQWSLSSFADVISWLLGAAEEARGADGQNVRGTENYADEEDEAGSGGLHTVITVALAASGVLTILANSLPGKAAAARAPQVEGIVAVGSAAVARPPVHRAQAMAPPSPMARLSSAPSPAPMRQSFAYPSPAQQRSPFLEQAPAMSMMAPPAALSTPAMMSASAAEGAGGRTLMALMGRTPATAAPAVATGGGRGYDNGGSFRRPPPPPASLMQESMPAPAAHLQMQMPQVSACYVEVTPHCQERVVKVLWLKGDMAYVQPFVLSRHKGGRLTFSRDKRFSQEVAVKVGNLKEGPFHIGAGGRAPNHINDRFGGQENDPVQQYRGPTTPLPHMTPMTGGLTESLTGGRLKSKLVLDENRFRHTHALNRLKDMGFDDSPLLREILTKNNGDIGYTLAEINGDTRGERA